jgi:hypothetical protein
LFAGAASDAQTPSCGCPAVTPIEAASGGDATPLNWSFSATPRSRSTPDREQVICYSRIVSNQSTANVRDIFWDVAGYRRTVIPAKSTRPACTDFAGGIASAPQHGPITFGVSSQTYDTSIWPPKTGWTPASATSPSSAEKGFFQTLRSEFVFDATTKEFGLQEARIVINSSASYDPHTKTGWIAFGFENGGKAPILLTLNIPVSEQTEQYLPYRQAILQGKPEPIKIPVQETPVMRPTTVVFYNVDGSVAALETAGLYVPANGKPRISDEAIWKAQLK